MSGKLTVSKGMFLKGYAQCAEFNIFLSSINCKNVIEFLKLYKDKYEFVVDYFGVKVNYIFNKELPVDNGKFKNVRFWIKFNNGTCYAETYKIKDLIKIFKRGL